MQAQRLIEVWDRSQLNPTCTGRISLLSTPRTRGLTITYITVRVGYHMSPRQSHECYNEDILDYCDTLASFPPKALIKLRVEHACLIKTADTQYYLLCDLTGQ